MLMALSSAWCQLSLDTSQSALCLTRASMKLDLLTELQSLFKPPPSFGAITEEGRDVSQVAESRGARLVALHSPHVALRVHGVFVSVHSPPSSCLEILGLGLRGRRRGP